ncbi:MAG: hypothetical protein ACREBW_07335 [Candidatus Micrarchaeaceae archaeon]
MKVVKRSAKVADDFGVAIAGVAAANATFVRTPTNVVLRAVDNLSREYKELLSVLDEADWGNRLAAWGRLNIPAASAGLTTTDVFTCQAWLETGLLILIESGALQLALVTAEVTADLASLRKSVQYHNLIPQESAEETVVEAAPAAVTITPTEQCVQDYLTTQSHTFRAKWMVGNNRIIFDQASVPGGPIDQAVKAAQNSHGIGRA